MRVDRRDDLGGVSERAAGFAWPDAGGAGRGSESLGT